MGSATFTARVLPGTVETTIVNSREQLFFGAKPELRRVFELSGAESLVGERR